MDEHQVRSEELRSGDTATIENTRDANLAISIATGDGTRLNLTLAPGQVVEFYAGKSNGQIIQRDGDASALLIVRPELPS